MSKTHKVTLVNSFHGTTCTVLVPEDVNDPQEVWRFLLEQAVHGGAAERRRLARVRRTLCPWRDCRCGVLRPA